MGHHRSWGWLDRLCGRRRAAYQTALVNSPPAEEKVRLRALIEEIRGVEDALLES